MNADERYLTNMNNKTSQSYLLCYLWIGYITKNAHNVDQYGDPEYRIDETIYSTSPNSFGMPVERTYCCQYNSTTGSGWFYLTNEELDSLCKRFYTEEEIETAKLQLELRE